MNFHVSERPSFKFGTNMTNYVTKVVIREMNFEYV